MVPRRAPTVAPLSNGKNIINPTEMNKGINLDGDAAVVGGIHSDSHDVINNVNTYNTTNHTTNNQSVHNNIYQASKTAAELRQTNEQAFLQAVCERFSDGILDEVEMAELNRLRLQLQIPQPTANAIIDEVRRSAQVLNSKEANNFLSAQLLEEIYNAISVNNMDVLTRKFSALEKIAAASLDSDVQFYYNMLLGSIYPEKCTISFINTPTDNYWQLFWAHIAYVKLGNIQIAEALLPRLGGFGAPQGDVALLMAVDNLWDYIHGGNNKYYADQTAAYLAKATEYGMSETLYPLWYAVDDVVRGVVSKGEFKEFFAAQTLKEFRKPAAHENKSETKMAPPPMPKFNPQNVTLGQMQGFNPLEAAKSMSLGASGTMPQMPCSGNLWQQPQAAKGFGMPPMPGSAKPGMPTPPPMPGAPAMPSQPMQKVYKAEAPDEFNEHYGIVMTDTNLLAQKYGTSREEIIAVFQPFFETAESQNMHWGFLDVADYYGDMQSNDWTEYNHLISQFIEDYGLPAGPDLHLLIVGGDDVVPVPMVNDPYEYGSGTVPTDTCYSFDGTYLPDLVGGSNFLLEVSQARNNVARLPLEDGPIQSDPMSDLGAYFNLSGIYGGGIPVDSVVMNSNSEWIPASATMSQHLPLLCATDDPSLTRDRMYVSPGLLTDNEEAMDIYCDSIAHAGMLMFNLHGADSPGMPGFYSSGEAFNPELLLKSSARVLNTVACFGARYKGGYTREQSMLLSALYGGGILLYAGSLIPVPMYSNYETDEARELMLHPGTGSEVFMRLFPLYQFKGMTAGRALLQAKCDYFNMMRHVEHDGFSLSTALMFCLYGNPMLHVKARQDVIDAARGNTSIPAGEVKSMPMPVRKTLTQRLMQKNRDKSVLEQAMSYVDSNLSAIRSMTEQYLYRVLGLPPAYLDSIDAISRQIDRDNYETGYSFNYFDPHTPFSPVKRVETDASGRIKRIYSTK